MGYLGKGLLEKEGIIKRIESFKDDSDKIRIIVKSSLEGRNSSFRHAMLNIDDDLFVSLERYHSIITTYKELSAYLHKEVNSNNKESLYETKILFSRYATDINSVLRVVITSSFSSRIQSTTICRKKLRVDYDWVYISGLTMLSSDDHVNEYRKRIVDYLRNNMGERYLIGNFRSQAMKLTEFTVNDSVSLRKAMDKDKRGRWILHNPRRLLYHNGYNRCTNYTFKYNYMIIANGAFSGFANLESIIIPNSVKYIGDGAFNNCTKLVSIYFSRSLESIGTQCFANCHSIKSIVIPNSVTAIESQAFMNCELLNSIVVSDNLKHIGWSVFDGCSNGLKIYINKKCEENLRKVLFAYEENLVILDSEEINKMRAADEWGWVAKL